MGRKLDLNHLSDEECRQILEVIQRDFKVRHSEKERFSDLQKYVYEEAQKRMVLSRQQKFNEKHCICCFSSFGFILNRKVQCQVCHFFICKNCRAKAESKEDVMCIACVQQHELQVRACEWFYAQIRARFKRFGSAKVVRSLYKRSKDRGSGSDEEESQNSDSGFERQRSPSQSFGSGFDLAAFMSGPKSDQETNTAIMSSLAILTKDSPLQRDWLSLLQPPMNSVGVQAPQDNMSEDGLIEEALIQPSTVADAYTNCACHKEGCHDRGECSSPSLVVYDPHGDQVSRGQEKDSKSQPTPPPVANGRNSSNAMLFHVLSPIEEMSSPDGSSDRGEQSGSKPGSPRSMSQCTAAAASSMDNEASSLATVAVGACSKGNDGCEARRELKELEDEEDASIISPKELDSGIHLGFSNSMEGDTPPCPDAVEADKMLSQRLKMQNFGCSDSFESVSSTTLSLPSLDANDTHDSLETHIHSSHSDLESPTSDIHEDFDSTNSTITGKIENADDDWKGAEADKVNLSRSSSEDTLKSDEDEGNVVRELSMEEFLDEIQTRTSSMTEEEGEEKDDAKSEESASTRQSHSGDGFNEENVDDISKEEESENRDHVSLHLEFNPRSFYKRSRSSDDFRTIKDEDQKDDPGSNSDGDETKVKTKDKSHRRGRFASNRFIRYDSLPLVVEVYEADSNSPSFSPVENNRSRFVYDSGQDSESPNDTKGSPRHQPHNHSRSGRRHPFRPSRPEDICQGRQISIESNTTDSTLPKSTPISSGPTTPDSDRKRHDSHTNLSSESEFSPECLRRDKVLFTRQLLQQHKEYHQQEGIRPSEGRRVRSYSTSTVEGARQSRASYSHLHKQSSLQKLTDAFDDEEIPAGYRRFDHSSKASMDAAKNSSEGMSVDQGEELEDEEERDDTCGVSNSDEIVGLLSEQDIFDSSDDDEEEDFEDANTTLTDDINGNGDSNHNDDIHRDSGPPDSTEVKEEDYIDFQKVESKGIETKEQREEQMETDLSEKSEGCTQSSEPLNFCSFRSRDDATDDGVCSNIDNVDDDNADDNDLVTDTVAPVEDETYEFPLSAVGENVDEEARDGYVQLEGAEMLAPSASETPSDSDPVDFQKARTEFCDDDTVREDTAEAPDEAISDESQTKKEEDGLSRHPENKPELDADAATDAAADDAEDENPEASSRSLKHKTDIELANLAQKLSIKQGEVLQSAEEVLTSANQLSSIQSGVDALESILSSLERKVCKGVLCSQTSSEYEDSEGDYDEELLKEDLCDLELQLAQTDDDNPNSQINMASAVRLITATALKVIHTTEEAIGLQQDEPLPFHRDSGTCACCQRAGNSLPVDPTPRMREREGLSGDGRVPGSLHEADRAAADPCWIDSDNNVFQSGPTVGCRTGELASVEKDRNANAVNISSNGVGSAEGSCRVAWLPVGHRGNRPAEESPPRTRELSSEVGDDASRLPPVEGDLRGRKGVPKESLRLELPPPQKPVAAPEAGKNEKRRCATPDSAKPCKAPESTVSPGSRSSTTPSSGPILHLTSGSGSASPPTATLLFSCDDQIWDYTDRSSAPASGSDPDLALPLLETTPDEGRDTKDASTMDTLALSQSPARRPKLAEVSVFENSFSLPCGDGEFSPDFLAAFYDRVSELEERVYLSAGKVFTLEERLEQLELEVGAVDCSLPDDVMAALEDKVALTVAQVQQCEREVSTVEDSISGLDHNQERIFSTMYSVDHIPSAPGKLENISSARFVLNHPALRLGPDNSMGLVQIEIPSGSRTERVNARRQSSASDGDHAATPLSSPNLLQHPPGEGALTQMDGGVVVYTWGDIVVTEVLPSVDEGVGEDSAFLCKSLPASF